MNLGQLNSSEKGQQDNEDISKQYKCSSCGRQFDSLGDMQRHMMLEHVQKGDTQ